MKTRGIFPWQWLLLVHVTLCGVMWWQALPAAESPGKSDSVAAAAAVEEWDSSSKAYQQALRKTEKELAENAKPEQSASGWNVSAVLSLVALLLAIGLTVWAARWTRGLSIFKPSGREMQLLDRMAISKQSTLLLLRFKNKDYWLADHPKGVTLLADWPVPEQADANLEPKSTLPTTNQANSASSV